MYKSEITLLIATLPLAPKTVQILFRVTVALSEQTLTGRIYYGYTNVN